MKIILFLGLVGLVLGGCAQPSFLPGNDITSQTPFLNPGTPTGMGLPNPASVFCEKQGYSLEIRTAADGSQSGVCIFPDGSECDEWAYFRGECQPVIAQTTPDGATPSIVIGPTSSAPSDAASDGCKIYQNTELGYSFHYPADATLENNDDPLHGISIVGPVNNGESWPSISISHPSDREDYRPPENADLLQWLTDHNLLGEARLPDVQIAGTTAIHLRHERSPQSYAFDRYYYARAGQLYTIIIGHTGDREDWNLYNHFLESFQFEQTSSISSALTAIPTARPIDPADYQGFWTYTHTVYGFSIMLPEDWVVEETTTFDPIMNGHTLILHPEKAVETQSIRMTFRRVGEEAMLWPTGVGAAEFIEQGTLDVAGQPARRILLVCPSGEVTSIWYHGGENEANIRRGDLEFAFIYSYGDFCQEGYSLGGKMQNLGEMIIASLKAP